MCMDLDAGESDTAQETLGLSLIVSGLDFSCPETAPAQHTKPALSPLDLQVVSHTHSTHRAQWPTIN